MKNRKLEYEALRGFGLYYGSLGNYYVNVMNYLEQALTFLQNWKVGGTAKERLIQKYDQKTQLETYTDPHH